MKNLAIFSILIILGIGALDYVFKFQNPADISKEVGMLSGSVSIGPICPVERIDHPCNPTPEMYAAHKVFVYNSNKIKIITTLIPDAQGNFSVTLPVGDYIVDIEQQKIGFSRGTPQNIKIITGQTTSININIDTGIR